MNVNNIFKVFSLMMFIVLSVSYTAGRYTFMPDKQIGARSTPYSFFIVDTWTKDYSKGDLVVFKAERTDPVISEGQFVVKFVIGITGESVVIDSGSVSVGDSFTSTIPEQQANKLGKKLSEFDTEYLIPDAAFFSMGTHPRSYDSRYWGPVFNDQIVGRAYPVN